MAPIELHATDLGREIYIDAADIQSFYKTKEGSNTTTILFKSSTGRLVVNESPEQILDLVRKGA